MIRRYAWYSVVGSYLDLSPLPHPQHPHSHPRVGSVDDAMVPVTPNERRREQAKKHDCDGERRIASLRMTSWCCRRWISSSMRIGREEWRAPQRGSRQRRDCDEAYSWLVARWAVCDGRVMAVLLSVCVLLSLLFSSPPPRLPALVLYAHRDRTAPRRFDTPPKHLTSSLPSTRVTLQSSTNDHTHTTR